MKEWACARGRGDSFMSEGKGGGVCVWGGGNAISAWHAAGGKQYVC